MVSEVGKCLRTLRVGVAVAAQVRTGIVRADVLADDAAARLALSLVFLRFWDVPAAEHVVFRSDEVHEYGIIVEEPHHQFIIDALVVPDTIRAQIGLFAACGVPILICKPLECVDVFRDRRHIRLQFLADIVIQRELEVILPES